MAQKLTGQARADAIRKLSGWGEVPGRDAIARGDPGGVPFQ